ncbi:LPS assembly lipoprotein LptE [Desulfovibrio sp. OttesenSCG-928-C06]|nr:LPS assembly lipoprotein LptE [Desulfovibrio sp. OttesenSCG-928-C06]
MSLYPKKERYGAGTNGGQGNLSTPTPCGARTLRSRAGFLILAALLVLPALYLGGCGYGFQAGKPTVLGEATSTLSIKGIEQPTLYPWLSQILRSNIRDEVSARKVAVWVDSGKSDYSMQINVKRFTIRESVSNKHDDSLLFRASMIVQAIVYEGNGNTEVWRSGDISYAETYDTYYERTAAELLSKRIAERLVSSLRDKF